MWKRALCVVVVFVGCWLGWCGASNTQIRLPHRLHLANVVGSAYRTGGDSSGTQQWLVVEHDQLFVARTSFHAEGYHFGRLAGDISTLFTGQFHTAPPPLNRTAPHGRSGDGDIICVTHPSLLTNATLNGSPHAEAVPDELTCYELAFNDTNPTLLLAGIHEFTFRKLWSQPNFLLASNRPANSESGSTAAFERAAMTGRFLSRRESTEIDNEQLLVYDSRNGDVAFWAYEPNANRFVRDRALRMPAVDPNQQIRATAENGRTQSLSNLVIFDRNGTMTVYSNDGRGGFRAQRRVSVAPLANGRAELIVMQLQPVPRHGANQTATRSRSVTALIVHRRNESQSAAKKYSIFQWDAANQTLQPIDSQIDTSEWGLDAGLTLFSIRVRRNGNAPSRDDGDDLLQWSDARQLFSAVTSQNGRYRWTYTQHPLRLDDDPDRDGIATRYELGGLDSNSDGVSDEPLHVYGASPFARDVFVEVDWMVDGINNFTMLETSRALAVREYAKKSINCHIFLSDVIPHIEMLGTPERQLVYDWETFFDPIKYRFFTPRRWGLFHYVVFGDRHNGIGSQVSGRSRGIPGRDFLVTLGGWASKTGTVQEQTGTFLHELGHNLGLRHGGNDNTGGKPNHLSIMNHIFQIVGLWRDGSSQWLYSEVDCSDLDETNLDETRGVECRGISTVADGRGGTRVESDSLDLSDSEQTLLEFTIWTPLNSPTDFNRDGRISRRVSYDLNYDGNMTRLSGGMNEYAQLDLTALGPIGAPPNISLLSVTPTRDTAAAYTPYSHRMASHQPLAVSGLLPDQFPAPPSVIPPITSADANVMRPEESLATENEIETETGGRRSRPSGGANPATRLGLPRRKLVHRALPFDFATTQTDVLLPPHTVTRPHRPLHDPTNDECGGPMHVPPQRSFPARAQPLAPRRAVRRRLATLHGPDKSITDRIFT